jgi:hypothetical protein
MRKLWGKAGAEQPESTCSTKNYAEANQAEAVERMVLMMLLLLLLQLMQLLMWLLFDVVAAGIVAAATATFAVVVVVDVAGACNGKTIREFDILQTLNPQLVVAVVVAIAAVAPGRNPPGRNPQTDNGSRHTQIKLCTFYQPGTLEILHAGIGAIVVGWLAG